MHFSAAIYFFYGSEGLTFIRRETINAGTPTAMVTIVSLSRTPWDSRAPATDDINDILIELAGPSGMPTVAEGGGVIDGYGEEVAVAIELFVNEGPIPAVDKSQLNCCST